MSVSVDEIKNMIGKINIIDIRSIQSYNNNHIPTSINVPFEKLIIEPSKYLNSLNKYFIYCRCGITSKKACQILSNLGYKVVNIDGGYENWILKGY